MKTVKLYVYFMLAAAMYLVSCNSSKNEFTIQGTITGELKDSVFLYYENDSGKMITLGESLAENGEFTLKGTVGYPTMATLVLRDSGDKPYFSGNQTMVILEPGKITLEAKTGDFINAVITGGESQKEYNELMTLKNPVYAQLQEIYNTASKETDPDKADSIKRQAEPLMRQAEEIDFEFFKNHPSSLVTAFTLQFYVSSLDYEKLTNYYEGLSAEIKQSRLGKDLLKEINNLKAGSPGSTAADFTTTDVNGNLLSLADFKGKYVIIDFWASWCVPCRKSFPHLIGLYNQYKDKGLEIICIADDDKNPEAWKAAIEKDNTGMWHHALRGLDMDKRMKNEENPNDISDKFGIHSLPTKILIDPNGVIIGRYVGDGETEDTSSIDAKLKEIFG